LRAAFFCFQGFQKPSSRLAHKVGNRRPTSNTKAGQGDLTKRLAEDGVAEVQNDMTKS